LEPERQAAVHRRHFGPAAALDVPAHVTLATVADVVAAHRARPVAQLDALRLGLSAQRSAILKDCDQQWVEQQAASGLAVTPIPEEHVRVTSRFAGRRFDDREVFEREWSASGEEIAGLLDAGKVVVIE
jgi:hypothetical protein